MKTPEIKIEPDRLESLLNGHFKDMSSWFEKLVNLMFTRAVAREKGDYDNSDYWRAWLNIFGWEVKDTKGKFLAEFTRGSYRNAFQRDIHEELHRRFKNNENYGQLYSDKRNERLYIKALKGVPVKTLLKQGRINLLFWRLASKLRTAKFEFKMRHWHRVWLVWFMFKLMWRDMWKSSAEIRLDNNS